MLDQTVNRTTNYRTDQQRSLLALRILKKDVLSKMDVRSIETESNEVLRWLDQFSGIDWVGKTPTDQIVTFAARVQFDADWRTFTVRYKRPSGSRTELEKRLEAIKEDYAYPTFTLQAYCKESSKELISCGIIKTKELYEHIKNNLHNLQIRTNKQDGVQFIFVRWGDLPTIIIKEKLFFLKSV